MVKISENVSLAPFTTLKIGGPARYFIRAENDSDVRQALEIAAGNRLPVFVLGGGSNILVADKGFDGVVIQIAHRGIEVISEVENKVRISVAAGEEWDSFVAYCIENDLAGVECLSGIPGLVGGTPVQNVGAYGQEVSETILTVRCFDRSRSDVVLLNNAECGFSYRSSIFNTRVRDRYVVLGVEFSLHRGGEAKIVYKDLKNYFNGRAPTLCETRDAVLEIRRSKSMVIDPDDENSRSAGSFFKNPVVTREKFENIATRFEHVPSFPVDETHVKIPAAWLIENAGFQKGFRLGNAGISTRHNLALVNFGAATAAEIISLKNLIQTEVETKFEINLQPEPVFIGF